MRAFTDHDQVADLRIAIHLAENLGFATDATVAPHRSMRPVDLGHIRDPRIAIMGEVGLTLYISADIAPANLAEVTQRLDTE
jgi:hypothetical protein